MEWRESLQSRQQWNQTWSGRSALHIDSLIWPGEKTDIYNESQRPEIHQNSLQMCRNPLSSHNYSVSKFQVQTPSRIAYPSNSVHITAHKNNLSAKHPFKLQFFITKLFSSEFSPETWQLCDCDCDQDLCTFWMNSDAFLVFRTHPESSCRSILR